MAKVTIEDISRATGLSRGTVSRALNDRPDISEATKRRVLDACQELNYVPSHAARSLATGRNYAAAVLVERLDHPFTVAFVRGIVDEAAAQRYLVHVVELRGPGADPLERLHTVTAERIDGLLVAAGLSGELHRRFQEEFERRSLVSCGPIDGIPCDILTPDHVEAGRLVGELLMSGGNRDVLYVHADDGVAAGDRLAGFHDACRSHGIDPHAVTLTVGGEPGRNRLEGLAGRLGSVRAVGAADDFLAVDVMMECRRHGRTPGEDLAVVGQGNERVGECVYPPLATIDFSGEEIGRRAMETLLQRITKSRLDAPQTIKVAPRVIERASLAPLR